MLMVSSDHIDLLTVMTPVLASGLVALHVGACTLTISDALDEQAFARLLNNAIDTNTCGDRLNRARSGASLTALCLPPMACCGHRSAPC